MLLNFCFLLLIYLKPIYLLDQTKNLKGKKGILFCPYSILLLCFTVGCERNLLSYQDRVMLFATEKPNQQTAMEVLLAGVFVLSLQVRKITAFDPKEPPLRLPPLISSTLQVYSTGEEVNLGNSRQTVLPASPSLHMGGKESGAPFLCLLQLRNKGLLFSSEVISTIQQQEFNIQSMHRTVNINIFQLRDTK